MEMIKSGMKISRVQVFGFENAIYGMRLPLNSEAQSDSIVRTDGLFDLGPKDLSLMLRLSKAGTDHRKVLRMLHVQACVKMPMSWWAHFDTYKVGTTAISRSRMHKLTANLLTKDDFAPAEWNSQTEATMNYVNEKIAEWQKIQATENISKEQRVKQKVLWREALDALPMTYCQERKIDLNYEVLVNILGARYQVEKLSIEWDFFCEAMLHACPYLNQVFEAVKAKRTMTTEDFKKL